MATSNSNRKFSIIAEIKADVTDFQNKIKNLKAGLMKMRGGGTPDSAIPNVNPNPTPLPVRNLVRPPEGVRATVRSTATNERVGDGNASQGDDKNLRGRFRAFREMFTRGLKETERETKRATKEMSNNFGTEIPNSIKKASDALTSFSRTLKAMISLYAGKKLFDFTLGQGMEFETYQAGFEAVMGSAEKAKNTMAEIEEFAQKTPYNVDQIVRAGITLESAKLDSSKWLKTAGNLASANSAKGSTIEYTSQILANIQNGNSGEALMQLRQQGIGKEDLAKQGVRFSNNGQAKTAPKELMMAVERAVEAKFGDQMEKKSATAQGMISNIQDNIEKFGRMISDSLYGEYKGIISDILASTEGMMSNGQFKGLADGLAGAFKPLIEGLKSLTEAFAKAVESGAIIKVLAGISTAFQVMGGVISSAVGFIKTMYNALMKLLSALGLVKVGAGSLTKIIWGLVSAFASFKIATVVVTGLMGIYKAIRLITTGIKAMKVAMMALQSSTIIGFIVTLLGLLIMMVLQIDAVKNALGGFLDKLGMGKLAEMLGLKEGNNVDDIYDKELAQMEADMKQAEEDAKNPPENEFGGEEDESQYKKGLDTVLRTAIDDIDIQVNQQGLKNQTGLQGLELQGVYKDSQQYANTERDGNQALIAQYNEGMRQMRDIIAQAGDDPEWRDVSTQAQTKLLEYQQKSNELLLGIQNNTAELKNAIQMIDLGNNKYDLEKQIALQETELGGTRQETYAYWAEDREMKKKQVSDYRNAYEKIKSLIPTLDGEEKIQAEIKSLEYLQKSNDLLLQIKKNTDPRNGTFNLPSDIKAYSLLEDRQGKGKSGAVVSGNNFVMNVNNIADQKEIDKMFNDIESLIYERLDSDTKRG